MMNRAALYVTWFALVGTAISIWVPVAGTGIATVFCLTAAVSTWRVVRRSNGAESVTSVEVRTTDDQEPERIVEVREALPADLVEKLNRLAASLEIFRGLKGLVAQDTEKAVVQLTEALFELVRNSKEVTTRIEQSLRFISDGDQGLGHTVANLDSEVRVFHTLADHFQQLRGGLDADITTLTETVGSINEFSETLSDLADQTNVLAINASIEAARVGIHGRGFAVIATQVQVLAKNSKEISEKMARTVRDVVEDVHRSFDRQKLRINEAGALITKTEHELRQWSDTVAPQMEEVQGMVSESQRLAGLVTAELNDVTVSLQFQDRTKQVLDHMDAILHDAAAPCFDQVAWNPSLIPDSLRKEVQERASKHFTVQDEWKIAPLASKNRANVARVEMF